MSNRLVNVGPDAVGVNFYSYRSNALFIQRVTSRVTRSIFAGEAGQTYRVLVSSALEDWSPSSTHKAESSGLFEFYETNAVAGLPRLFQVVRP